MILRRKAVQLLLIVIISVIAGCAKIPDADIAFLDRAIPLGIDAQIAQEIVERRGFAEIETRDTPKRRYDERSQTFIELPLTDIDIVKQNIGFVELKGIPNGQLECFAHSYTRFIASGDRLICWTTNSDNKITWRQAGWLGAML